MESKLVKLWWEGTWALGFRGHIARWLLEPAVKEQLAQQWVVDCLNS